MYTLFHLHKCVQIYKAYILYIYICAAAAATEDPRRDALIFRGQRGRRERYPSVGRALRPSSR